MQRAFSHYLQIPKGLKHLALTLSLSQQRQKKQQQVLVYSRCRWQPTDLRLQPGCPRCQQTIKTEDRANPR